MQQHDDVVSSWLSGSDSSDNPAGPLYIDSSTEKKMTSQVRAAGIDTMNKTTQSCASGCACC